MTIAPGIARPERPVVFPGVDVRHVRDGEADLLIPDVALARAGTTAPTHLAPADVLLAVDALEAAALWSPAAATGRRSWSRARGGRRLTRPVTAATVVIAP